jgi:putative endonuclease
VAARHLSTGRSGEEAAARYLKRAGYRILERNWRHKSWELDLVCQDGDTLVFVEVKTRDAGSLARPDQALDQTKRARLTRAASHYLSSKQAWERPCRFDLVSLVRSGEDFQLEHVENAFDIAPSLGGGHTHWQPW